MATNLTSSWCEIADGVFADARPPRRSTKSLQPNAIAYCLDDGSHEIWREHDLLYRQGTTEEDSWLSPWMPDATQLDIVRFEESNLGPVLAAMVPGDTCNLSPYLDGGVPRG